MKNMKKRIFAVILCIGCVLSSLAGCGAKETMNSGNAVTENIEFPEYFEKSYDKFNFQADVVIADGVDVNQICRRTAKRALYDNDKAYERLFGNIDAAPQYKSEIVGDNKRRLPYEMYAGSDYETISLDGQNLTFALPFFHDIRRCARIEKGNPKYNMDKYELNGELAFMSREDGEKQIISLLKDIGFEGDFEFFTTAYAMNYKILEQEEYAMDMNGNEDISKYKETWTEDDNCYYYFLRQKIDGLPVYYLYSDVYKELDVCNSGVSAIYSKDGLQYLAIDKLFTVDDSKEPVPAAFMPLEELAQSVEDSYNFSVPFVTAEIHQMELHLMAEKGRKTYDLFPVWILSGEQIETKEGEEVRTPLQIVIDAETGKIIS